MITRRDFIVKTATTASSPFALQAAADQDGRLPLRALPSVRTILAKPTGDGRLLLISDGAETPPKLIKAKALEREFGPGIELVLTQPDHWRMIDEEWFTEEDLYEPTSFDDPAFMIWHANYRPETEAHDLLYNLFRDEIAGPIGAYIPDLGLTLAEHPSTPRYATAKLDSEYNLPHFATELAARTKWFVIETSLSASKGQR